ncbi:hypothetical protein ABPG74_000852 [Tetrahymena malaccensis]
MINLLSIFNRKQKCKVKKNLQNQKKLSIYVKNQRKEMSKQQQLQFTHEPCYRQKILTNTPPYNLQITINQTMTLIYQPIISMNKLLQQYLSMLRQTQSRLILFISYLIRQIMQNINQILIIFYQIKIDKQLNNHQIALLIRKVALNLGKLIYLLKRRLAAILQFIQLPNILTLF